MITGLYEQLINQLTQSTIDEATRQDTALIHTAPVDSAEAADVLSSYFSKILHQVLNEIEGKDRLSKQVAIVNNLIEQVSQSSQYHDGKDLAITPSTEQLLAWIEKKNSVYAIDQQALVVRPETSIATSSLFTGAVHEPQMESELKKEIPSANQIDLLVSFIRWTGLRTIINELRAFTQNGGKLRVITTAYMGATEWKAIAELDKLENTQIKVSYDTKITRLHAKSYVFHRDTGFSTAYVGSSNLSKPALSSGLEWNVKVTTTDLPEVVEKIMASFESYWNAPEFETYDKTQENRFKEALQAQKTGMVSDQKGMYFFELHPYAFQSEILDQLEAEREIRGHYRNLVVAATGTGKTVISAFDYKRFCDKHPGKRPRLLFVAHREEILKQSQVCFRGVLHDANFGSLYVGAYRPDQINYLFISVQTLNSSGLLDKIDTDFYDFIIVDEFHHAAAPTYQALLNRLKPKVLLGLTATPERMDGGDITKYFDGRIAAEIRLSEAINRKLLVPFQYFGVTDVVDLSDVRWSRGGYERSALENVFVMDYEIAKKRAAHVLSNVYKYVSDMDKVHGMGFCVTVKHAQFMTDYFNAAGIPSLCVVGTTPEEVRSTATQKLATGEIKFVFTVDVYNEGVDVPILNTVLFLRPTESLTIFLQQLGRGLRHAEGKDCLTVLDFIGQANRHYRFEEKYSALLSDQNKSVEHEIKKDFIDVPKGCFVQLEKVAQSIVLKNIRQSLGNRRGIVSRLSTFVEDTGQPLDVISFVTYYHLNPRAIYKIGRSFARLCVDAEARDDFSDELEADVMRSMGRFCDIDSRRWIDFILNDMVTLDPKNMTNGQERWLRMTYDTLWNSVPTNWDDSDVQYHLDVFRKSTVIRDELFAILRYNRDRIDFIDHPVCFNPSEDYPLDVYCTYTRNQIMLALDYMTPNNVREGVKYLPDLKLDVFFVTLNKSDKDYSPSTMYADYSVNESVFHWQSQNQTAETSKIGQRYIHHRQTGNKIAIFVRDSRKDAFGQTSPYTFLGLAQYISHEGERPMSILWKLEDIIPAKYLKRTNQMLVG